MTRPSRSRKLSQRVAVVDESERRQAIAARLQALENDNENVNLLEDDTDDEYKLSEDNDEVEVVDNKRKKKQKVGNKRNTRRGSERTAQSFAVLLEEAELERLPKDQPSYLTAAAKPATTRAARKLCSVCGQFSTYKCVRCGSQFCCLSCYGVHCDTRCLKFTA